MTYKNFVEAVEGLAEKYGKMNPDMCLSVISGSSGLVITHSTRAELRRIWVDEMLAEYSKDFKDWSEVILCDKNRKVMVVLFANYWGTHGYGVSKCSPTDAFDEDTGMAVAYARFRGYPIPDFV